MHEAAIGHPQAMVPIVRPAPIALWLAPPDVVGTEKGSNVEFKHL